MLKKLLIGGVLGAVVLFAWQGIWWGVLPFAQQQLRGLPEGEVLMQHCRASGMESGIYYYPPHPPQGMAPEQQKAAWERLTELARNGPTVTFMAYQSAGYDPLGYSWYIKGFVADLVACILLTLLVAGVSGSLPGYGQRVGFCLGAGLIGTLSGPLVFGSFFLYPTTLLVLLVVEAAAGWILAALLIALATRPAAAS